MSLFTSFNQSDRTQNGGKHTASPLSVRFEMDAARYRFGTDTYYRTATRWVEKSYEWRGYDLATAKAVQQFYANGNANRQGYYRKHISIWFVGAGETVFGEAYNWKNMTSVQVEHNEGRMYTVKLNVQEADPFWFNEVLMPTSFDGWAGLFASFVHTRVGQFGGEAWSNYSASSSTPYLYESYYDEPLTVVT